jgi:hypothetical protein
VIAGYAAVVSTLAVAWQIRMKAEEVTATRTELETSLVRPAAVPSNRSASWVPDARIP